MYFDSRIDLAEQTAKIHLPVLVVSFFASWLLAGFHGQRGRVLIFDARRFELGRRRPDKARWLSARPRFQALHAPGSDRSAKCTRASQTCGLANKRNPSLSPAQRRLRVTASVLSLLPYDITIYDRISQTPAAWDTLVAGKSLFLSRDYLRVLEAHGPAHVSARYAVVTRNQAPLAAVAAHRVQVDDQLLAVRDRTEFNAAQRPFGRLLDNGLAWLRNQCLAAAGRHILFCGHPFSCGLHGIAFAEGEEPELLWPAALDALHRIQQADGQAAFIVVKDFLGVGTHHRRPLLDRRFARLRIEPSMDLRASPSWRTYADYLDSLNAKYRKVARKTYDAIDRYGAVVELLQDLAAEQERLCDLYTQVERHAQVRFGVYRPSYLPALAEMLGPTRFRCSLIRKECRVVGFSLVLKDGDTAVAHVVGFDYEANEQAPVYLRLLHRVIEDGLSLGCRVIHFGRTALEPKARLGALPTDTEIWVKHSNPVINRVVGPLLRLVPQDTAPHREPFRTRRSGHDAEHSQDF